MASPTPEDVAYYNAHASDDMGPDTLAAVIVSLVLSYSAVTLRIISRKLMKTGFLADDWLIIVALLFTSGMCALNIHGVIHGYGKHIIFVTNQTEVLKGSVPTHMCFAIGTGATKVSILLFYYRIFPIRSMYIWGLVVGGISVANSLAFLFVIFLRCIPLQTIWTHDPNGKCVNVQNAYSVLAAVNVITDILILMLPIKKVWGLHTTTKRKMQISGIFAIGGAVCIFGIIRCVYVNKTAIKDSTYANAPAGIWSLLELSIGVVCACLPTYKPLFSKKRTNKSNSEEYSNFRTGQNSLHNMRRTADTEKMGLTPASPANKVWASATKNETRNTDSDSNTQRRGSSSDTDRGDMTIHVNSYVQQDWTRRESHTQEKE